MSLPSNVPELAGLPADAVDAAEINRCLESAACLVQGFAERGAVGALEALLAAAGDSALADPARTRQVAAGVLQQTTTLQEEVGRFLAMTEKDMASAPMSEAASD